MNIIHGDMLNEDARKMYRNMEIDIGEKIVEFEKTSGLEVKDIQISKSWTGDEKTPKFYAYFTEDNEDITDAKVFTISKTDRKKIREWYNSLMPEIMQKLKKMYDNERFNYLTDGGKEPYYGTIDGPRLVYSFGATSIGDIITVEETITGKTLDLSCYDNW